MKKKEADFAIIGGGIVGLSVAHGLLSKVPLFFALMVQIQISGRLAAILDLCGCEGKGLKRLSMQHGREMQLVYTPSSRVI